MRLHLPRARSLVRAEEPGERDELRAAALGGDVALPRRRRQKPASRARRARFLRRRLPAAFIALLRLPLRLPRPREVGEELRGLRGGRSVPRRRVEQRAGDRGLPRIAPQLRRARAVGAQRRPQKPPHVPPRPLHHRGPAHLHHHHPEREALRRRRAAERRGGDGGGAGSGSGPPVEFEFAAAGGRDGGRAPPLEPSRSRAGERLLGRRVVQRLGADAVGQKNPVRTARRPHRRDLAFGAPSEALGALLPRAAVNPAFSAQPLAPPGVSRVLRVRIRTRRRRRRIVRTRRRRIVVAVGGIGVDVPRRARVAPRAVPIGGAVYAEIRAAASAAAASAAG